MLAPPPPIVHVTPAGATTLRLVVRTRAGVRLELRFRGAGAPHLLVIRRARRRSYRRVPNLFPVTRYNVRARACRRRAHALRCSRWTRWLRVTTRAPRVAAGAAEPPMGALPALGFNDSAYADNHPELFARDVHELGGSIARRIVLWPTLEPDSGAPDTTTDPWRRMDAFVDHAAGAGLSVTFEVAGVPSWARELPTSAGLGGAPTIPAWRDFIGLLSARITPAGTRYADVVKRWGWNEADCCSRATYLPPASQVAMLASVYRLLHDRVPAVDVMANAGCPCGFGDVGATQAQIIRAFGAAERVTGERVFDSVSVHVYPGLFGRAHGWEPTSPARAVAYVTSDFGRIVAELDSDFSRRVDFHVTETGWMTTGGYHDHRDAKTGELVGLSEACQSRAVLAELSSARRYSSRMRSLEYFLIRDQPFRAEWAPIYSTGLERSDGSPKALRADWQGYVASPPAEPTEPCRV